MLTFFVVNNNFVTIFLSEKWQPIIPVLYVLVPIGMLQSVYTLAGVLFLIKDKTQLWFYWGIFSAIITLLGFYIGLKWNILGVAIGYLISNLILMFPGSYIAFNLIKLKVQSFLKNLSRTFAISMTTAFLTFLLKIVINDINSYYSFFLLISFSLTAYFLLSYKFNKNLFSKLIRQIKF
jgi:PST family polysaccharide transporter